MKKTFAIGLVLILLGTLFSGRALSSSKMSGQPPATPEPQAAQASSLFLPILANSYPYQSIFGGEFTGSKGLTDMKAAGLFWTRLNNISWANIEPIPGVRDWSSLAGFEQMAIDMKAQGMEVIAVIRGTPSWAQKVPGSVCGPIKDKNIPAFVNFVKDVVSKYSKAPYFIHYWEIQNEEDVTVNSLSTLFGCWGDPADTQYYGGQYYAKVIKQVYPAIKAVDPQSQVILGGLLLDCDPNNPPLISGQSKSCTSANYLEGVLVGGGGNYFDAVSFHAYDYYNNVPGSFGNINFGASEANHTVLTYKAAFLKDVLNKYNYSSKPLLNTEVALLCLNGCDANFELTKAYYLARAYADALRAGLLANVWYTVAPSWRNTSLIDAYGNLYPAYRAYQFAHSMMGNATSITDLAPDSIVRGYEIRSSGQRVWLVWTPVGQTSTISLQSAPLGVYDTLGNALATSQTITVDYEPVYVVLHP